MTNADWLSWIQGVGFPAAVAGFVLWRMEKRLASIEIAVVRLAERMGAIGEDARRDAADARHDAAAVAAEVADETKKHRSRVATER